ncbi:hypothetical protein QT971_12665 [Microcoleus sp. herbarium19]
MGTVGGIPSVKQTAREVSKMGLYFVGNKPLFMTVGDRTPTKH